MATNWKSQQGEGKFALQFETDSKEKYRLVEKAAQMAMDGKTEADFVEVVRCKDCKHKEKTTNEYCKFWYKFCASDNNFCSYGERKVVTDTNVGSK